MIQSITCNATLAHDIQTTTTQTIQYQDAAVSVSVGSTAVIAAAEGVTNTDERRDSAAAKSHDRFRHASTTKELTNTDQHDKLKLAIERTRIFS
jgi:hypothetical protein